VSLGFVISAAFQPLEQLVPLARAAEEAGFEALSFSDHVVYPETLDTPYPYTDDGSRRYDETTVFPDPWVAIGALSAVTTRLRFTNNVFVLPMRNPFLAAKAISTAAVLSNDRVTLTIGVGWSKIEFELMGQSFRNRGRRTDEMIEVMRKLWTGDRVEHRGEFYEFAALRMSPAPGARIPVWVGGISDAALRRAARNDGWISDLQPAHDIIESTQKIRKRRAESGRRETFDVMASASDVHDVDGYRRLEDAGVTHILTMPWAFYHGLTEDLTKKCDGIRRFADEVLSQFD
jgi:probable F420-dependent oxidoreductase